MYDNAAEKVDEIAERILMLDGVPAHNFSEYLKTSKVKETGYVTSGSEGIQHVMDSISYFIASERNILKLASEAATSYSSAYDDTSANRKNLWGCSLRTTILPESHTKKRLSRNVIAFFVVEIII